MGHPSKYGPAWVVSSKSMTEGGDQCVHMARVTDDLKAQRAVIRQTPLRPTTTHLARDEYGAELELTAAEAWAWVRGAKAGDFDHLFDTPPVVDLSAPGAPVDGWPEKHMVEAAFGLLCSAQPHEVLGSTQAAEWSRAFERWRDAYNRHVSEVQPAEWSCSA